MDSSANEPFRYRYLFHVLIVIYLIELKTDTLVNCYIYFVREIVSMGENAKITLFVML